MQNVPVPMSQMVDTSHGSSNTLIVSYYIFKILPMLIGAWSIYLGYRLFILGVTGQASLSIESKTVTGQLLNAAPGLFFALGGIAANIVAVWKGVQIGFKATQNPEPQNPPPPNPPQSSDTGYY
jgi:hypothetical protein